MLQTQRKVLIGIVLLLFFLLFTQCLQFIKEPKVITSESFMNAGPTRPDDCLCLPGYVPSNTKESGISGKVINQFGRPELYFLPSGSRTAHWIPSCTMQGIDYNFCASFRVLQKREFDSMVDLIGPTLTTKMWNDIHNTTKTDVYFCQNLKDPTDTRKCTTLS